MQELEKILEEIEHLEKIQFSSYTKPLITIEDVEKIIRKHMGNDGWIPVEDEAIRDLQYLIEEYSAYPPETGVNETVGSLQYCITALKEIQRYREIGTVKECREAMEKQKPKKPVKDKYNHNCCPNCGWIVSGEGGYGEEFCPHCENCGQAIRWENFGEMEDE